MIVQLIKQFKSKNMRVMALKGVPHKYYLEPESSDSFRFLEAGADEVCLVAKKELLTMKQITEQAEVFTILENQYKSYDILLLEGLRNNDIPLIEVFNSKINEKLKFSISELSAVISDKPISNTIPNFNFNHINDISNFMEGYHG